MKKTQLKALTTKIHGLAVKSANGKKTVQNKAIERIATLLDQAIETEIKQAYAGIASQVRGLAEKLEPAPAKLDVSIGAQVPSTVKLESMPEQVSQKVPQIKSHLFFIEENKIVLVEAKDRKIVDVIE